MSNHLHVQTRGVLWAAPRSPVTPNEDVMKGEASVDSSINKTNLCLLHISRDRYAEKAQTWLKWTQAAVWYSEVVYDARGGDLLPSCGRGRYLKSDCEPLSWFLLGLMFSVVFPQ